MEEENIYDDGIKYHPLESFNIINSASQQVTTYTPPSVYDYMFQQHLEMPEHQIYRRKGNIEYDAQDVTHAQDENHPINILRTALTGANKSYEYTKPLYIDHIPELLTDKANMIEDPETFLNKNTDWELIDNELAELELGMRSYVNNVTKKLEITFHGYDSREGEWSEMVWNQIINPRKDANKFFIGTEQAKNSKKEIEALIEQFSEHELSFSGHSWGAFQARHFAAEFDTISHLFNAHIMPWNTFKKAGEHFFHTTITDPTDFKHLFPSKVANESHFYYPANQIIKDEPAVQKILSGHFLKNFVNSEEVSNITKFAEVLHKTGILQTIAVGLTAKDAFDSVKKDIKHDNPIGKKISDSSIDVANKAQEFVVGNAVFDSIFASSIALAPETGGITLVAGGLALGGAALYTVGSEYLAPVLKSGVVAGANGVKKGANNIAKSFKHLFHW
jgi:hypothetical protein